MRETGRRFLGSIIADHSKVAIGSRLNTGSIIGFNANVVSSSFPPKFVPSFAWSWEPSVVRWELEKAIETAKIMMDRRSIAFSEDEKALFETIYRLSALSEGTI